MFLDAALGLLIWGTFGIGLLVLLVLGAFTGILYGIKERRSGKRLVFWLVTLPLATLLVAIAVAVALVLVDDRTEKHLVLDLRKSPDALLADLAGACASTANDDHCDSNRYKLNATLVFRDGRQVSITPTSIRWSQAPTNSWKYILLMGSKAMTLDEGRAFLLSHSSLLSEEADDETKRRIVEAVEWLGRRNDRVVYSEVLNVPLRAGFSLQLRKNIDRVSVDFSLNLTS